MNAITVYRITTHKRFLATYIDSILPSYNYKLHFGQIGTRISNIGKHPRLVKTDWVIFIHYDLLELAIVCIASSAQLLVHETTKHNNLET